MKNIQKELDMFATPFNVQPSDEPDNLQMEITELQNNNELKAKYNNQTDPNLELWNGPWYEKDFPPLV